MQSIQPCRNNALDALENFRGPFMKELLFLHGEKKFTSQVHRLNQRTSPD